MRFSSKLLKKCEELCRADQTITSLAEPPGLGKDEGRTRMNMKILDLTEQNLGKAPEWEAHPFSCKYCLYWEYPELSFDPAAGVSEGEFSKKLAWLRRVRKEWGSCGKLLFVGNEVVGYAQYAPARFLPAAKGVSCRAGKRGCSAPRLSFHSKAQIPWERAWEPPFGGDPGGAFSAGDPSGGDLRPPGER
jgi:hypothetical protein